MLYQGTIHNARYIFWYVGTLMRLYLLYLYIYIYRLEGIAYDNEKFIWIIFIASALTCMISSTLYHLLRQTSPDIYRATIIFDYLGIAFLIFGSFASALFYIFYCEPMYMKMYITVMSVLCVATGVIATHPTFNGNDYRFVRFGTFGVTCLFAVVPYVHFLTAHFIYGTPWLNLHYYVFGECFLYTLGGFIFAFRFPEGFSRFQGKYDLFFASHQLWQ
jgi:adiponectin receptor